MTPPPCVWPTSVAFWIACIWAFWPEFRIIQHARQSIEKIDANSLRLLIVVHGAAFLAAFPLAYVLAFQFTEYRAGVYWLGIAVMISGSLLRRHCWTMLGTAFTGDVRVADSQKIITTGAYAFLRHPSYTGGILFYVGIGIALGSWASIALLAVATFTSYAYRISVEERALLAAIGEPYRLFMSTRKRFIPFIY